MINMIRLRSLPRQLCYNNYIESVFCVESLQNIICWIPHLLTPWAYQLYESLTHYRHLYQQVYAQRIQAVILFVLKSDIHTGQNGGYTGT